MPRGDGTGPEGKGPATGRGQGKCINKNKPANTGKTRGLGSAGSNRGQGAGSGRRGQGQV